MEMIRVIREMREATNGEYPKFVIWENVKGSFSSNKGEDFRCVLEEFTHLAEPEVSIPRPSGKNGKWSKSGAISGSGWSIAWRLFDAQHWGVPQRRQRIALVMDLRGQRAAEVLFERTGVPGNPDESIPAWKATARTSEECSSGNDRMVGEDSFYIAGHVADRNVSQDGTGVTKEKSYTLDTVDKHCVAYTLKIRSGCEGGGKGALIQDELSATLSTLQDQTLFCMADNSSLHNVKQKISPAVFENHAQDARYTQLDDIAPTVTARYGTGGNNMPVVAETKAFAQQAIGEYKESEQASAMMARDYKSPRDLIAESKCTEQILNWIVRRLTPVECERLQGFPDRWTDIGEWVDDKGKKHKPADSPRYKALGNSIALPQWFWIAQKMKSYLGDGATLGSLFDGIGGFCLVWQETYGKDTPRWASEIEPFCIAVTKRHFPEKES